MRAVLLLLLAFAAEPNREQLDRLRNLGKAFYENPTTQLQAVEQFKKALDLAPDSAAERVNYGLALLRAGKTDDGVRELIAAQKQDPKLPHTWFNLGIVYKKASEYDKAIEQFRGMLGVVPADPVSHYNLGVLLKLTGKSDEALAEFEIAARLNPNLAGPHFQLYNAYRLIDRAADAAREKNLFDEIKKRTAGAAVPEDLEWSFYAEIHDPIDPSRAKEDQPPAALKFTPRKLGDPVDAATAGLAALDVDANGKLDVLIWSSAGVQLIRNGTAEKSTLPAARAIAPGDFNNDGFADLAVITATGAELYTNVKGTLQKAAIELPKGDYHNAVWLDYDHDYDLDLFLLGKDSRLLRNNGRAGFSDESSSFPFAAGTATAGVWFDLVPDTDPIDLVIAYADRAPVLYRDQLAGRYKPEDLPVPPGARHVIALDFDNDSRTDLVFATATATVALRNGESGFTATALPGGGPLASGDFENRGLADILNSAGIHRNLGLAAFAPPTPNPAAAALAADLDADGKIDLAAVTAEGAIEIRRNETATPNTWFTTSLTGVKNMQLAYGAEVEVKAGSRYGKQIYLGLPLHFGLRAEKQLETVRITWANGLVQNETRKPAGAALAIKEAQRLSGSCPMIFTWNGREWQFITDVLGVAPLGASSGDGEYFPLDHDEYIQIPPGAMQQAGGQYEVRVTEELREVSYLDQIQLVAIDHPAGADLFTNEKFKSPPFPDVRYFAVKKRMYPVRALDTSGRTVRERLLRSDRSYAEGFRRRPNGMAEMHSLTLDFGAAAKDNRSILVLSGWVDWADGSTFKAASQESKEGLVLPYLQVRDAQGQWRTVIEDMGIPAGKPKTIVVDLSGKFLSPSREVRIVTNLCVYWDEIFLSQDTAAPQLRETRLNPTQAGLRFRGFSRPVIHPERRQPESFIYSDVLPVTSWNPTPGLYTRYGDVRPLLDAIDDRMVIMGSGDELQLFFDARALPPVPQGWKRDFLLFFDGWAKDADANTAFSTSVTPLPFHGMSSYPYKDTERFPDSGGHRRYQEEYNVRPALRLMRPLNNDRTITPRMEQ